MSIPEVVDQVVMTHLNEFGCVKNMEPLALHMLTHSEHPLLRFRRAWMRRVAVQQALDAEKRQKAMTAEFQAQGPDATKTMRRQAIIDPYYMAEMPRRHGAKWHDKDFVKSVREAQPKMFK